MNQYTWLTFINITNLNSFFCIIIYLSYQSKDRMVALLLPPASHNRLIIKSQKKNGWTFFKLLVTCKKFHRAGKKEGGLRGELLFACLLLRRFTAFLQSGRLGELCPCDRENEKCSDVGKERFDPLAVGVITNQNAPQGEHICKRLVCALQRQKRSGD